MDFRTFQGYQEGLRYWYMGWYHGISDISGVPRRVGTMISYTWYHVWYHKTILYHDIFHYTSIWYHTTLLYQNIYHGTCKWYHVWYFGHCGSVSRAQARPGQSQGAGAQTQIASRQRIPQGKGPPAACPREELHQFQVLIGLYGEYIIPASLHSYTEVLRAPALYTSPNRPLVSEAKMRGVWASLRDRLSLLDS